MKDLPSLRPFQVEDIAKIRAKQRCLIAHEMGLGKTRISIEAIRPEPDKQTLIMVPGSAMAVWEEQLELWAPELEFNIIEGTAPQRAKQWRGINAPLVICTPDVAMRDLKYASPIRWERTIVDEWQAFRNRNSGRYKFYKKLLTQHKPDWRLHLTGTPARRGAQDLFTTFQSISPYTFSSYWKFVNTFCYVDEGDFGGKEVMGTRNLAQLKQILNRYMIRRTKADVLPELPPKNRHYYPVRLTAEQKRLYEQIERDMIMETMNNGYILMPNQMTSIMRLRQLLVCPKMLDESLGYGAGLEAIGDYVEGGDPHIAIFTPFRQAMPYIKQFFDARDIPTFFLYGGLDREEQRERIQGWKDTKGIICSTIPYAKSFDLTNTTYGFFLGFEWDPDVNEQAEDRLWRLTTSSEASSVDIWYIRHENTIEQPMFDILDNKSINVGMFLNNSMQVQRMIRNLATQKS